MSSDKLTRREALQGLGALAAAIPGFSAFAQDARNQVSSGKRPNVLFIPVDDLNTRIGCYGHPFMKTPNMDKLAGGGVRFDFAYCQYPLCNPTRSSLLTGRRPDTTTILKNEGRFRDALPDVVTLPQHFQRHGYWLARTGKIYHGGLADDAGWDVMEDKVAIPADLRGQARVAAQGGKSDDLEARKPGKKGGKRKPARRGSPLTWAAMDGPDESLADGQIALKAIEFIHKRPTDKPFFIAAGFHKPHLPFVAPLKYFDLYPLDSVRLPEVPKNDWDDLPGAVHGKAWNEGVTDDQARELIRAYQACVSFADAQIGKVLDALEQARLLDNTVIVLWGDHGFHLTEHGLWRKGTLFEESCRAALIVSVPGRKARGGCPRLVEFVDVYPTLAEVCGLPAPEGVEGTSFGPLMDDPKRPWKKAAFTQTTRGRSLRTERWRYSEWAGDAAQAELYDHQTDPREHTNLAKDPKHAHTVKELHELLAKGWRAALPSAPGG